MLWSLDQRDVFVSALSLQAETEGRSTDVIKVAKWNLLKSAWGSLALAWPVVLAISDRRTPAILSCFVTWFCSVAVPLSLCICRSLAVSVCTRRPSLIIHPLDNADRAMKCERRTLSLCVVLKVFKDSTRSQCRLRVTEKETVWNGTGRI